MVTIKINQLKALCKDYQSIENYDKAIADTKYKWEPHHRLESHFIDGALRGIPNNFLSKDELISLGMYYDRPSSELIFMRYDEHRSLHWKGYKRPPRTKEHSEKISNGIKKAAENGSYRNNKFHKPSNHTGMKWYTNGSEDILSYECPEGYKPGRSKTKGRVQSKEERERRSASYDRTKHPISFKLTDQQKQNLSFAMLKYYGGLR